MAKDILTPVEEKWSSSPSESIINKPSPSVMSSGSTKGSGGADGEPDSRVEGKGDCLEEEIWGLDDIASRRIMPIGGPSFNV